MLCTDFQITKWSKSLSTGTSTSDAKTDSESSDLATYAAFVLPAGKPDNVQLFQMGLADSTEKAVRFFRAAITLGSGEHPDISGVSIGPEAGEMTEQHLGAELRKDLIDRIRPALGARSQTGLGEYRTSEGVFGLRRAFELGGASSVVMSLWRVPGEPTRLLMKEIYRQLLSGKSRAQTLQLAQLTLRRRFPETYFWGAFVCFGDPGPIENFVETSN